jgi:hypothetical protein
MVGNPLENLRLIVLAATGDIPHKSIPNKIKIKRLFPVTLFMRTPPKNVMIYNPT